MSTVNPSEGDENIPLGDKCEYSKWGRWGECSKECGKGEKKRYRTVLVINSIILIRIL